MRYYTFASPVLLWVLSVAGILASFQIFSSDRFFEPMIVTYLLAGAGVFYWFYFFTKGVSSNIQAPQRPHHIKKIITDGVYARVRHPIYSADIALALGIFLVVPSMRILISVVWIILLLIIWACIEEDALSDLFGEEYKNYKRKVPMFIPRIGSISSP